MFSCFSSYISFQTCKAREYWYFSINALDYLLDLEIVGSELSIFGDKNEILSIIVEYNNIVKYRYCM